MALFLPLWHHLYCQLHAERWITLAVRLCGLRRTEFCWMNILGAIILHLLSNQSNQNPLRGLRNNWGVLLQGHFKRYQVISKAALFKKTWPAPVWHKIYATPLIFSSEWCKLLLQHLCIQSKTDVCSCCLRQKTTGVFPSWLITVH